MQRSKRVQAGLPGMLQTLQVSYRGILPTPSLPDECIVATTPLQALLERSMWDLGLLPVQHPAPFYGDPSHLPPRPPVFAGRAFRLPSTAVDELPLFTGARADPHAPIPLQRLSALVPAWQANAGAGQGQGYGSRAAPSPQHHQITWVPAKRPPSRAAADSWLAARRAAGSLEGRGGMPGTRTAGGLFAMDANTGKLKPQGESQVGESVYMSLH
jgi:hypothetical protein